MIARFRDTYKNEVTGKLQEEFAYGNRMQIPGLEKIHLSLCLDQRQDHGRDTLQSLADELSDIAGQRTVLTKAKKSVANFKLREGMEIGAKVTLRGANMYEFLERLVCIALPRIRDFRGVNPDGFDGRGNYNLGIEDQTIFPEVNPDKTKKIQGFNITIVTSANTDAEARALLKHFGMPYAVKNA